MEEVFGIKALHIILAEIERRMYCEVRTVMAAADDVNCTPSLRLISQALHRASHKDDGMLSTPMLALKTYEEIFRYAGIMRVVFPPDGDGGSTQTTPPSPGGLSITSYLVPQFKLVSVQCNNVAFSIVGRVQVFVFYNI